MMIDLNTKNIQYALYRVRGNSFSFQQVTHLYVAKYIIKQKYPAYLEVHGFTTKSNAGRIIIRKPHVSPCLQCMKQLIHVHVY